MFRAVGVIVGPVADGFPKIDSAVEQAYLDFENREWMKSIRTPHGRPWHTSFHASGFPGGVNERRCPRKALYELMNIPGSPFTPKSRAVMEMGRAVEQQIVYRLGRSGMTVGGAVSLDPELEARQLRLEDREHWLTGSLDAPLDLRSIGWDHVTPMDVKSKDTRSLIKLRIGEKEIPESNVGQVMAYGHMCRLVHEDMGWEQMGLKPAEGGILYFASRENPRDTWEKWVEWDQEYVDAGLARLKDWIVFFQEGRLPERPKEWRWTEEPCKWCDFKKMCKEDIRNDIEKLQESTTIDLAKSRDPQYDPDKIIREVTKAWK